MQRKKRILFVTESHKLASGFGTYGKEVISRIHKSGKYEIAEFACYASPRDRDWETNNILFLRCIGFS